MLIYNRYVDTLLLDLRLIEALARQMACSVKTIDKTKKLSYIISGGIFMYKYVGNVIMFTINITPLSHQK